MDELIVVPGHGVTDAQLVNLFYRAVPENIQGHFFEKKNQQGMTYNVLSREAVTFAAQASPVTTFWHKDLSKGKMWKGRTISDQIKAKDSLILTREGGGADEVPYFDIEWGLEEEDSGAGQGRTYAAIATGGRPQGGGQGLAGMAGPQVAEDRVARGLATMKTAKWEEGEVPLYKMSPKELEELRMQLDEPLEKGWIRPSTSPFGAPVLFVPKEEGEPRMCIDYRGLNAITIKNAEPLPRIDDLLDRVQGCKYFSKVDLKSGYHQIEVHLDDQYKTTFRTRYGHYVFIVLPFGLTNAPTTFQCCMNDLFRPWLDRFVVLYLDDILMFSKTLKEHEGHLGQILGKLSESNFKINPKKCEWAKTDVLCLGHVLDGDGIRPEDNKITSIRDWPTSRTLTELRSFLGLANYYRKFVRNFSTIAAPLRRLLKKETIWKWDQDCTSTFKKLTKALIEYPVLKVADPSLPFVVTTDASQYGIGAVLQQDDGNGYRPVEFMSARMP
ncbi:hypothetical protein CBR_g39822 [Chara braunii]|uniref:Reverse transcriptase domain-containing protein n=1 Tax=Chara braunii TaxID=69332 RepID=A0A388LSE2_CHABU|nr:hypothetical protein CBR_g39822 [Chara braunii]|eukprot:GBG85256.1 hypothetical protein CBR_g39822 [Chara braunii]